MSEGTSVGIISLDLIIKDMVTAQVQSIADRAKKAVEKPFVEAGKTAGEALSKATAAGFSDAEIQKSLDDAVHRAIDAEQTSLKTGVSIPVLADNRTAVIGKSVQYDSADIQSQIDNYKSAAEQAAQIDMSRAFTAAATPADLLNQKLANLRDQMEQARRKSAEIDQSFDQLGDDGSAALDKAAKAAAQAEARIISIQQQINATQAAISAPAEKAAAAAAAAAEKAKLATERAAAKAASDAKKAAAKAADASQKAAERVRKDAQLAADQLAKQHQKTLSSMGKPVSQFLKSIKGALKSVFLMAGLYAAFRGIKTLLGEVTGQNQAFQDSLNATKANLTAAFMPIATAIMPLLNQLMGLLASASKSVASFVSGVFGKTYADSVKAASALKSTTSAAKAAAKATAGFDELNILSSSSSSASENSAVDYNKIGSEGDAVAESLGTKISALFDFSKIGNSVSNLFQSVKKIVQPIADFISNQIILPISTWAINDGLPSFFELLASSFDAVYAIGQSLWENFLQPLWNNFLAPVASWTGGALVTFFDDLSLALEWISGNQIVCDVLAAIVAGIIAFTAAQWAANSALLACPITWIVLAIAALIVAIVECVKHWDEIKAAAIVCWDAICGAWQSAATWFNDSVIQPIVNFFTGLWDGIVGIFQGIINWVRENWTTILVFILNPFAGVFKYLYEHCDGFRNFVNGVISKIAGFFSGLWNGIKNGLSNVKNFFASVFSSLFNIAKQPINGIIALINGVISGLNLMIRGLNKISISVPDWVPVIGGQKLGFNLGEIGKIPMLASGGIATQPTLAMIGEYAGARSNPEVVAPLDKLQAMLGGADDSRIIELLQTIIDLMRKGQMILVDGKVLMQLLQQGQDRQGRRFVTAGT